MDPFVHALASQQAELSNVLTGLDDARWQAATRCEGWDVADVVLHLAQTNELAIGSATGVFAEVMGILTDGLEVAGSIDDGAALMVSRERGKSPTELLARWSTGAAALVDVLDDMDLSTRVTWVAGQLSARTLATTRLAETWIHTSDVAEALGVTLLPSDRLQLIARLAWRTLPYAFTSGGRTMSGPIAFRLTAPDGTGWDFLPDDEPTTTITGPAVELCAVAARRVDPASTTLRGEGPDVDSVLALVRTYA